MFAYVRLTGKVRGPVLKTASFMRWVLESRNLARGRQRALFFALIFFGRINAKSESRHPDCHNSKQERSWKKWNFCQTNPIYRKCMDYNNMQPCFWISEM
jgi:hypothetical protein